MQAYEEYMKRSIIFRLLIRGIRYLILTAC